MTSSKQWKGAFKQIEDNGKEVEDWSFLVKGLSTVSPLFSYKRKFKIFNSFLLRLGIFFVHILDFSPGNGWLSVESIYYYKEKITF